MKKIVIVIISLCLTGCFLHPHKVDVQQGNVWPQETVQQLHLNMKKSEVESLLGAPLLANAFRNDYWTYVYTNQINGGKITKKSLVLQFNKDRLSKIEQK